VDRLLPVTVTATSSTGQSASDWIRSKGYALGVDGYLHRAPVAQSPSNAAHRDLKLVKSDARQPVRSNATFPNISSDLRIVDQAVADGLSSSSEFSTPSYSPHSSPLSAYTEHREQHHNDNEESQRQSQNRRRAKTDGRAKIAARVLDIFRRLEAVAGNDQPYSFTLRIHEPLLDGRQARKNPTTWMQRRIARDLKKLLGRDVPFAGVMEWRTEGRPELHCHGAIPLAAYELQRARDALRAAGGPWRDGRANGVQVDIRPIDDTKSFKGAYGLAGAALYAADDSRQTQIELDRRRSALDPQRQYHRAPNIIMQSGLQNREDYGAVRTTPELKDYSRKDYSLTGDTAERKDYEIIRTTPDRKDYIGKDEPLAKSQSLRTKEYRAKIKNERDAYKEERDALRAEVDDLRRLLAERKDTPAAPASLDLLSPECRAELDRLVASGKLERVLEWTAKKHAEEEADRAARPAVTPEPEQDAEPPVKETTTPDPDRKITLEEVMALMREVRQRDRDGNLIISGGAGVEGKRCYGPTFKREMKAASLIS
jgi:hypothetical protein